MNLLGTLLTILALINIATYVTSEPDPYPNHRGEGGDHRGGGEGGERGRFAQGFGHEGGEGHGQGHGDGHQG